MTICIFTGPTLPPAEAAKVLDAEYLPPAAIGDVYKAARKRPWAIGIIDGFFESTPSVWHKEVLWAMAQGIHVFGASSMGALRAAELADFGMLGVGAIFQAYRAGTIEDDDEVAVVHGPPELGYVQLSEAMVNMRATFKAAIAASVLSAATADALIAIAKSLYYKKRTYSHLLSEAAKTQQSGNELARLKAWLPENQINQKRLDAIAMLQAIKAAQDSATEAKPPSYVFEHTVLWDAVERQYEATAAEDLAVAIAAPRNGIFDELRLDPKLHEFLRRNATLRALSRRAAEDAGVEPTVEELQDATRAFRKRKGFRSAAELEAWLRARDLSREQFMRMMGDEARRRRLDAANAAAIEDALADELALADIRPALQSRADEKHAVLEARGIEQPTLEDAGLAEGEIIAWFAAQCGQEPSDADPEQLARQLGFIDKGDLLRAALREYCYRAWKDS